MSELSQRLISLDVFRGLTIAGMILVNNPGTWSAIYSPLKHAEWHGITPTDYIFPFFLFIVGVSIAIALGKITQNNKQVYSKIFSRAAAIFLSGLAISALPLFVIGETKIPWPLKWIAALCSFAALYFLYLRNYKYVAILVLIWGLILLTAFLAGWELVFYNVSSMRIPGVLQRIAVCYLAASIIFLNTGLRSRVVITVVLLLAYWALMTLVPVPGCEVFGVDDKACNLAAWLDRTIIGQDHMWRSSRVFDPEGILSTIPAIATTLFGVLTGEWLMRGRQPKPDAENSASAQAEDEKYKTVSGLFLFGTILLAAGWSWSLIFPLNKSLWTSSYSVYTAGLALLTLGVCFYLVEIKKFTHLAKPFVVFGVNALALFVFSGIMARVLGIIKVSAEGKEISLQQWIFQNAFLSWLSPINASLLYAIAFLLLWFWLMWLLYRRQIFIKL